ncbi:MAG: hypothetical protein V1739_07445 [Candidatus Omnitrophota bacterium]
MFAKILGGAWIILGVVFLMKPQMLRTRLQKNGIKKIRKYLFAAALALSSMIMSIAWNSEGILAKIVFVFGLMGIFKSMFFLKEKTSEKLVVWISKQSIVFFSVWAAVQICFGVMLLFLR